MAKRRRPNTAPPPSEVLTASIQVTPGQARNVTLSAWVSDDLRTVVVVVDTDTKYMQATLSTRYGPPDGALDSWAIDLRADAYTLRAAEGVTTPTEIRIPALAPLGPREQWFTLLDGGRYSWTFVAVRPLGMVHRAGA